ncbi:hypothetical protein PL222_23510, partial [Salmonella enterica]|uniref:RHS repeat domain-containing protein n=1 Tax=Salmonella enterica TaxID=28901 RepID=UPI0026DD1074
HYRGGFELLAKEARAANDDTSDFYPILIGPDGAPQEMYSANGRKVWRRQRSLWGLAAANDASHNARESCDAGFMGQWRDEESGLWYNLHRYMDSRTGQYLSPDPLKLGGGLNTQSYVQNPVGSVDPLGLAAADYPWNQKGIGFGEWFDSATVQDVENAMADSGVREGVKDALRGNGGMHEWFPVAQADKAKDLGYTYDELMKLSSPRNDVWFENVPDPRNPGATLEGPHSTGAPLPDGQSGRATSNAHRLLSRTLAQATSKAEANAKIESFISKYVRNAASILDALHCKT